MPRIAMMTMRHLRSNFLTKVSAMNEMRMTYSFEPTYRLIDGDLEGGGLREKLPSGDGERLALMSLPVDLDHCDHAVLC